MAHEVGPIAKAARELHKEFLTLIDPYRGALWHYCCSLTGSYWDGEDLFQETLAKAFAILTQVWQPIAPRAYLFRIATNAWIDTLRKRGIEIDAYAETDELPSEASLADPDDVRDAIEVLVETLPPRQTAVVLLVDVFGFTPSEVAGMVRCTVGAVYAALQRARKRLRARANERGASRAPSPSRVFAGTVVSESNSKLIDELVDAFRNGDHEAMLRLMSDSIHTDAAPGFQEFSKEQTLDGSGAYIASPVHVEYRVLWGRSVRIVMVEADEVPALHDISYQEWDNGKVVLHKSYYFCREFMLAAGKELGVPVQLKKPPGLNWEAAGSKG